MQLAVVRRHYPTNINHTPRSFERGYSGYYSTISYRGTSASSRQKQPVLHSKGDQAMATAIVPALRPPAPGSVSRKERTVPRKNPSLTAHRSSPLISRRHSWTSPSCLPQRDLSVRTTIMEASESTPLIENVHHEHDSLLNNKRAFPTIGAGSTFDMAYFLRNTGPSTPAPEKSEEDLRKPTRKKNRGIFKKRRQPPDPVKQPVEEQQKPTVFVPPEGVEQKVTARGERSPIYGTDIAP
jgi:hypothetical protein